MFSKQTIDEYPMGIMFHHFHDNDKHIKCQGSVSAEEFEELICWLKKEYMLLTAEEFLRNAIDGILTPNMKCLTFDDGLKCQFDIAVPVLKKYNLTAFWFLYTLPYVGEKQVDRLEVYHHFRFSVFEDINMFYNCFFEFLKMTDMYENLGIDKEIRNFDVQKYRPECSFYTYEDRLFRYVRNNVLKEKYHLVMQKMMEYYEYDVNCVKEKLWLREDDIISLSTSGHVLGMHSHSHHTSLTSLNYDEQKKEWEENKRILEALINKEVITASYPCGSFDANTIQIMKENEVTPICLEDIILEIKNSQAIAKKQKLSYNT